MIILYILYSSQKHLLVLCCFPCIQENDDYSSISDNNLAYGKRELLHIYIMKQILIMNLCMKVPHFKK